MSLGMKFTEEDKERVIEFLNMVAQHSRFNFNTQEVIKYFKLLSYMQQTVLPKMNANILEVVAVHEPKAEEAKKPKGSK